MKNTILLILSGLALFPFIACDKDENSAPETINSLDIIVSDMKELHEGRPHGVPSGYDWARGPRLARGNNPRNFGAMIAWGQLYEEINGNPATNTRVQIRNIKAWYLSKKDRKWYMIQQSPGVDGSHYVEDFAGNTSISQGPPRAEPDGGVSVKAGGGYTFHFWTKTGRSRIDSTDIAGIFTTVQARLVTENPSLEDDRSKARYILSMGGDYWLNLTADWNNYTTNADIGIGRFKFVTTSWQAFNMHSLTEAEIRQNPPPIE